MRIAPTDAMGGILQLILCKTGRLRIRGKLLTDFLRFP
jgi:hypothetical protein